MSKHDSIEILARALITSRGRVLLCQNRKHAYSYLPGGHVEFGEPAARAVERELLEEAGVAVHAGRLVRAEELAFDQNGTRRHELTLVFHVEHELDQVASREPGIEFHWAGIDHLSSLDIRPATIKTWLAEVLKAQSLPSFTWQAIGE